jgi:hypothetical protein
VTLLYVERARREPAPPPVVADVRSIWLESLDRTVTVPFDNRPVVLRPGFLGLESAPVSSVVATSPGVEGGFVEQVSTVTRPVMLPVAVVGRSQGAVWSAKRRIAEVVKPGQHVTSEGAFRVVCSSPSGVRELTCVYLSGLEGDETGNPFFSRFGLNLLAVDPFARDRDPRVVEFSISASSMVMVSDDPATAGPRGLASSVVIGENMPVEVGSEIPVWPRMDFVGPFDPLTVSASTGMSISVPGGVPSGSTLTVITDPRAKSIRLDGQLAAGMVARGSRIGAPFRPGLNNLNVAASGADENSRIVLSWRGGWRSLW